MHISQPLTLPAPISNAFLNYRKALAGDRFVSLRRQAEPRCATALKNKNKMAETWFGKKKIGVVDVEGLNVGGGVYSG
jgi:hypothetical protein